MNILRYIWITIKKMLGFPDSSQEDAPIQKEPTSDSVGENTPQKQVEKKANGTETKSQKEKQTTSTQNPTPVPPKKPNRPQEPKEIKKPYKIQSKHFFNNKLCLDYNKVIYVPYSVSQSTEQQPTFPIVRVPKKGCAIKYPMQGRGNLRGACERLFYDWIDKLGLQAHFYDDLCLFYGNCAFPYEPDFAYIDASKGIFVDIEIDEPYSGVEKEPIHYCCYGNKTIDDLRNEYFTERGWTVVRFSEKQIHDQCVSCLKYLFQLLNKMDANVIMPGSLQHVSDLKPEKMWTEQDANNKIRQREREKYLGISDFIVAEPSVSSIGIKDYPQGKSIETNIERAKMEERQWQSCSTVQDYERYISKFPLGKHAYEARMKKESLERIEKERQEERKSQEARRKKEEEEARQRQIEAAKYEHPHSPTTISTNNKPTSTPSSRGYA